jgi:hypothetical protein
VWEVAVESAGGAGARARAAACAGAEGRQRGKGEGGAWLGARRQGRGVEACPRSGAREREPRWVRGGSRARRAGGAGGADAPRGRRTPCGRWPGAARAGGARGGRGRGAGARSSRATGANCAGGAGRRWTGVADGADKRRGRAVPRCGAAARMARADGAGDAGGCFLVNWALGGSRECSLGKSATF